LDRRKIIAAQRFSQSLSPDALLPFEKSRLALRNLLTLTNRSLNICAVKRLEYREPRQGLQFLMGADGPNRTAASRKVYDRGGKRLLGEVPWHGGNTLRVGPILLALRPLTEAATLGGIVVDDISLSERLCLMKGTEAELAQLIGFVPASLRSSKSGRRGNFP
jgi:hypothetical protein